MKIFPLMIGAILILLTIFMGGCGKRDVNKTYYLTIGVIGNGDTYPASGTYMYQGGTTVTVTTKPDPNWKFDNWSGDITHIGPTVKIKMNGNKSVTANFVPITYTLTVAVQGKGTTNPPVGENICNAGTDVNINATPAVGWKFDHWRIGGNDIRAQSTTVSVNYSKTITAVFKEIK